MQPTLDAKNEGDTTTNPKTAVAAFLLTRQYVTSGTTKRQKLSPPLFALAQV
jgi:hypothetical protein